MFIAVHAPRSGKLRRSGMGSYSRGYRPRSVEVKVAFMPPLWSLAGRPGWLFL